MSRQAQYAKIREMENRLQTMNKANKEESTYSAIAHWQAKSDDKMKSLVIQRRFEELKERRERDLDARRQRLASKLYQEEMRYKQELIDSQETPAERRAKLAARARELATRREGERQKLADSLMKQAFDENCDVLREVQSKRFLFKTLEERTAQIEQKMIAKIAEEEEKRMFHEMNETERLKMEQRYLDDKRRDRERRDATVKVLDEQVRAVNQRRLEEAANKQQEIAELKALWDAMEREQAAQDAAERDQMHRLAAELQEFNRLKQSELSERDRRERELDLHILQEALAREALDEERERLARLKRQEDARHYREQLALMMGLDAEDNAERDRLIQKAFDEQQAKRDAELEAREEARRQLWAEVDAIRQEQIRYKNDMRAQRLAEQEMERLALEEDMRNLGAEAAQKRAAMRKASLMRRLEVQTQMVAKAHIKAAEEDEKLRARELAKQADRVYLGQVKSALDSAEPKSWHGLKKFDFYTH